MRITNFLEIGKLSASARDALNMKSWVAVSLKPFVFSGTIPTHIVNGTVWEQLHANFIHRALEITSEFHVVDSLAQGLGRAYRGRTFTVAHGTCIGLLVCFYFPYVCTQAALCQLCNKDVWWWWWWWWWRQHQQFWPDALPAATNDWHMYQWELNPGSLNASPSP